MRWVRLPDRNIPKLYVLNLLCGFVLWYPIEKLFLSEQLHVTAFGISISAVVFLAVQILFDVPSGVLADKWKRRYTLVLAMLSLAVGSLLGGLSHSLVPYLLATIFVGGFVVLTSGTFQAIMYDSLRDHSQQADYDKHQGRAYALFLTGLGLSSLAGGYIAQWTSYRTTYFATMVIMLIAAMLAITLKEPRAHKDVSDTRLSRHIRISLKMIRGDHLLMQLALLITAANILRGAQNEYAPLYFIALGLTAIPIGYATAAKWAIGALGQIVAPRLGRQALRLTPLFFITFLGFSLIHSKWSLVFFFIAGFLYAVLSNQAEAAVQDNTPSEIRATTLSIVSFFSNVLLIPAGLFFGWLTEHSNAFNGYLMIGFIGLVYLILWLMRGRAALRSLYKQPAYTAGPRPPIEETLA